MKFNENGSLGQCETKKDVKLVIMDPKDRWQKYAEQEWPGYRYGIPYGYNVLNLKAGNQYLIKWEDDKMEQDLNIFLYAEKTLVNLENWKKPS